MTRAGHFKSILVTLCPSVACAILVSLALLNYSCLSDAKGDPKVDSESHFLSICTSDADCPHALSCLCSVCTIPCSTGDVSPCEHLSADAVCVVADHSAICRASQAGSDFCGTPCTAPDDCTNESACYLGQCVRTPQCPNGSTWDASVGFCATPWTAIPEFRGSQVCGPYYYLMLPQAMNEFRARLPSSVEGGFLSVILEAGDMASAMEGYSPDGNFECRELWHESFGTWTSATIRRTAGAPIDTDQCASPIAPPPLATFLGGCGNYSFFLDGRALVPPTPGT